MTRGRATGMKDSPIGAEFRDRFSSWGQLDGFLADSGVPDVFHDRVKRQLLILDSVLAVGAHVLPEADLVEQHGKLIVPNDRLVMTGVTTTPMRKHGRLPDGLVVEKGSLPEVYACTREGSDGDLFVQGIGDGGEYSRRVVEGAYAAQSDAGFGGIVRREVTAHHTEANGHTVLDMRVTPRGGDEINFEIDFKSPDSQANVLHGPAQGGFRPADHRYLPIRVPGVHEPRFLIPPPEIHLGDMCVLATGPRRTGHDGLNGPWFRPKDAFTTYLEIAAGSELDGDLMRHAIDDNQNLRGTSGIDLAEYDVHGRLGQVIEGRDGLEAWAHGMKAFVENQPYLAGYPEAGEILATQAGFVRGLAAAGPGAKYHDGAWHRADGTRVPTPELPGRQRAVAVQTYSAALGMRQVADGRGHQDIPQTPPSGTRRGRTPQAAPSDGRPGTDLPGRGSDERGEGRQLGT